MQNVIAFLIKHGYALIFAFVLVDQLGVPFPAAPFLLAAGALARSGRMNAATAIALAVIASMIGHMVWYQAGRKAGSKVLSFICRISLEPDSCVRQTQDLFVRYGPKSLLIASFVPGLGSIAQPLAGMSGLSMPRFMALDMAGSALWSSTFAALGYAFSEQLVEAAELALHAGASLAGVLLLALVAFIGWKVHNRQKLLRELRISRISPQQLKQMLDAGEAVTVVDLRSAIDFQSDPWIIPGALRISAEELEQAHAEIPRGQDVILYCS